jgi:hypothetical protein
MYVTIFHSSVDGCLTIKQRIRDQVLMGELNPEACCSYGVCKGDVNVQGA